MCFPYCCLTCEHRQREALIRLSRPLVWVKHGSSKFVGQFVWHNLKILEAFQIGLQVSFLGDFASWSLELQLLQMKFKPKTRSMIPSENICFFHKGKQNGHGWSMMRKRVKFCETCHKKYPLLADKS